MSYSNRERLEHILDAITRVRTILNGVSEADFLVSLEKKDAVSYEFMIVGEASSHLSVDLRESHEDIPWHKIIGMRNIIVHDYLKPLPTILWKTATVDLPAFESKVKAILETMP